MRVAFGGGMGGVPGSGTWPNQFKKICDRKKPPGGETEKNTQREEIRGWGK